MKLHLTAILIVLSLVSQRTVYAQSAGTDYGRTLMFVGTLSTALGGRQTKQVGWFLIILGGISGLAAAQPSAAAPGLKFDRLDAKREMERDCRLASGEVAVLTQSGVASVAEKMDLFKFEESTEKRIQALCVLYRRVIELAKIARADQAAYSVGLAYQVTGAKTLSGSDARIIQNMFAIEGVF